MIGFTSIMRHRSGKKIPSRTYFSHPGFNRREPATRDRVVILGPSVQAGDCDAWSATDGASTASDTAMPATDTQHEGGDAISQHVDMDKLRFSDQTYLDPTNAVQLQEKLTTWFRHFGRLVDSKEAGKQLKGEKAKLVRVRRLVQLTRLYL